MCDNQPDAFQYIGEMLKGLSGNHPCMPQTLLYGEGWMLRLILQAAEAGYLEGIIHRRDGMLNWFSEAKLYTPFYRDRGEDYETHTNVDGIVGDFQWKTGTQTGVELSKNPERFEVFEAKMFSKLSEGVKANSEYDQAVRTVACMAQTLENAQLKPEDIESMNIAFWVIAPRDQIKKGIFNIELEPEHMRKRIKNRIEQFDGPERDELHAWKTKYFEPLLKKIKIHCESWETLIEAIGDDKARNENKERMTALKKFYHQCCQAARRTSPYADEVT